MSDIDPMPMSVEELKALISDWLAADTSGLEAGEIPAEITDQYGEDPLAGVDNDTYQKALQELHEDGTIPDDAYEQAQDQLETGDFGPGDIVLNITNIDNSIHTGDDFSGHIEQGDTTAVTNSGEGMAAGGDVYDSQVVTGDDNNTVGGDGDAGDGDDISADGAHIDAGEGGGVNFGSGSASGYNTDDHSDNSTNTYEDNDTDNSTYEDNDPWTDNSTNTFEDNDPYTDNSTYEDNDTDNSTHEDNDPYEDNDNVHVDVDVEDEYHNEYDGGDYKAEVAEDYGDDYEAADDHDLD